MQEDCISNKHLGHYLRKYGTITLPYIMQRICHVFNSSIIIVLIIIILLCRVSSSRQYRHCTPHHVNFLACDRQLSLEAIEPVHKVIVLSSLIHFEHPWGMPRKSNLQTELRENAIMCTYSLVPSRP